MAPLVTSAKLDRMVSELFNRQAWRAVEGFDDFAHHRAVVSGTVRVAFNLPEMRNAFRSRTVDELHTALEHARSPADVGCVLLTGNGTSPRGRRLASSSGGDQRVGGRSGDEYADGGPGMGRLHILEVQRLIRFMPKVVIGLVAREHTAIVRF